MNQLTRVSGAPRPVREVRVVVVAGRNDHEACLRIVTGFHSPATTRRSHLVNRRAEPHIDPMMVYVVLEVPDPVVTGRKFSVTTVARTIRGHRRHPRRRVEPPSKFFGLTTSSFFGAALPVTMGRIDDWIANNRRALHRLATQADEESRAYIGLVFSRGRYAGCCATTRPRLHQACQPQLAEQGARRNLLGEQSIRGIRLM